MISSELEGRVRQQLLVAGWSESDLVQEPMLRVDGRVWVPDYLLTHNNYPFASLDVKRQLGTVKHVTARSRTKVHPLHLNLISDGANTVSVGPGAEGCWSPVPTPRDLWTALGWDSADPRLAKTSQNRLKNHQIIAVARALDALMVGEERINLSMPTGSGKTAVLAEICLKMLDSGCASRILIVADCRSVIYQALSVISNLNSRWNPSIVNDEVAPLNSSIHLISSAKLARKESVSKYRYDLIFLFDVARSRRNEEMLRRLSTKVVVSVSSTPRADVESMVYDLSVEDLLADEPIVVPAGSRLVRLRDVADIIRGKSRKADDKASSFVTARDLLHDAVNFDAFIAEESALEDVDQASIVKPGDILLPAIQRSASLRVIVVPSKVACGIRAHSSLLIVRVRDRKTEPNDIAKYLSTERGRRYLMLAASQLSGLMRLNPSWLLDMPCVIPDQRDGEQKSGEPFREEDADLGAVHEAVEELRNKVLPDLEAALAGLEPVGVEIIAARLRRMADSIAPQPLKDRILETYPMPISLAYRRFLDSRFNVYEQVGRLRDLFEAVAFFVYNVVLSDFLRNMKSESLTISNKKIRCAYDGYSMANRIGFVQEVVALAKDEDSQDLFMPELIESSFVELTKRLQRDFRNKIAHTATASESRQKAVLNEYRPVVEILLEDLAFLSDYRLARLTGVYMRDQKFIRRVELYRGTAPELDEQEFEMKDIPGLAEHEHLVLLNENDECLDLHPTYQFVANEQTTEERHMCFLKQRKKQESRLIGESVHAPLEVELKGVGLFDSLIR